MLENKNGKYVLYTKNDYRRTGQVCFIIGLVLLLMTTLLLFIFSLSELFLVEIIPGVFIVIGGIFALAGRKTVIDPQLKSVETDGLSLGFNEIHGININSYEVHSRSGMGSRFTIGIHRQKDFGVQNKLIIADEDRELRIRQLAQRVAKIINVSVFDLTGEIPEVRGPGELDMSFMEKLQTGRIKDLHPEPLKPEDVYESLENNTMVIGFKRVNEWLTVSGIVFGFLSVVCLLALWLAGGFSFYITLAVLGIGLLSALLIYAGRNFARNGIITISSYGLQYQLKGSDRIICHVDFSVIESINLNLTIAPSLNIISDDSLIKIPLDSNKGPWIYNRICRFLLETLAKQ